MGKPKHAKPITIFRGDDTDFVGNRIIEISLDTDIDLSGITARFELCGFTQEFDNEAVVEKRLEVVIEHDTTKTLPLGAQNGSLILFDANGKIKHVDTCIPFIVTNTTAFPCFTGDEQITCELRTKIRWSDIAGTPTTLEGYGIENAATRDELSEVAEAVAELDRSVVKTVNGQEPDENGNVEIETGGGGTSDYRDLENKPSINRHELSGDKTSAALGLASAAQGAKADTAYQKPQTGIPASDMSSAVQTSLGNADNAVQPSDLAYYIPFANPSGQYDKTSVAIGFLASVIYRSQANVNAIALGREAKVWAAGGVSIGQYGIAADEDAVVITANLVGDQTYTSHGIGTLNFGSRSGMRGIFVQHMHIDAALAFLLANIDERANVNSFLCEYGDWQYSAGEGWVAGQYFSHGGRLYKVLQNIEEYTEWENVPPTSYEEITLQKVLFASPAFTGTPTAPTPAAADNSTKVATTAFVKSAIDAATPSDYEQVKTQVQNNTTAISEIEGKIPNQASAQNQLADKAFVNSSIATNTAFYISDGGKPFQSLADLESYEGALTNNDYAFVVGRDAAGNTTYTRYKWSEATETWSEEYVLNNSSFTAEQWEAISSGITSGLVAKLGALPTADALAEALAGKANRAPNPTAGHLAALDASGNPIDSGWTAGDLAGYAFVTKTVSNGTATLDDHASNIVGLPSDATSVTLTLPAAVPGRVRDFIVRLTLTTTMSISFIPITGETITWDSSGNPSGTFAAGTHLLYFTEAAPGVFHWGEPQVNLTGQTFNFATTQGVMDALSAVVTALGGFVIKKPSAT